MDNEYAVTIYFKSDRDKDQLRDFFKRSAIKASSGGPTRVFIKLHGNSKLESDRQRIINLLKDGPQPTLVLIPRAIGKAARARALKSLREDGTVVGYTTGEKNAKTWKLSNPLAK